MAMITCADCGQPVAENALFCPNCHSAVGLLTLLKRFMNWGVVVAISVLGGMALIALIIFFFVKNFGG